MHVKAPKIAKSWSPMNLPIKLDLRLNFKQLLDEVFVISGIVKVEVSVIS